MCSLFYIIFIALEFMKKKCEFLDYYYKFFYFFIFYYFGNKVSKLVLRR